MVDIVDSATRSRMMSGIRGTNTKPEILIRSLLHRAGFRFRLHAKDLKGKPDIVLPRYHAVIFVHGCFWHGHNCALFKWPNTRSRFWHEKIERNRLNDEQARDALFGSGWRIAVVWECALKGTGKIDEMYLVHTLSTWLRNTQSPFLEIRGKVDPTAVPCD